MPNDDSTHHTANNEVADTTTSTTTNQNNENTARAPSSRPPLTYTQTLKTIRPFNTRPDTPSPSASKTTSPLKLNKFSDNKPHFSPVKDSTKSHTYNPESPTKKESHELPGDESTLRMVERDRSLLEINLSWGGNSPYFRQQIIAWHQSKHKDRIMEMIYLLDRMLENPAQYLYLADSFSKQHYELPGSVHTVRRHYSYFGILNALCTLLLDCREECKTGELFQLDMKVNDCKSKTMEDVFKPQRPLALFNHSEEKNKLLQALLQRILKEETLRQDIDEAKNHFLLTLSDPQRTDPAITGRADLEAARIALLQQAGRDLLEISNRFDICPAADSLSQIRHITLVNTPSAPPGNNPPPYNFMDLLAVFVSSGLPQIETLIIENFSKNNSLHLTNLIAILVKQNSALKIIIGKEYPVSIFTHYQQKYPNLTLEHVNIQSANVEGALTPEAPAFFPQKRRSVSDESAPLPVHHSPK